MPPSAYVCIFILIMQDLNNVYCTQVYRRNNIVQLPRYICTYRDLGAAGEIDSGI